MFDRVLALMDTDGRVAKGGPIPSGDLAAVVKSLGLVADRSGAADYLAKAGRLVAYALRRHRKNGCFTSGLPTSQDYYCARAGSADLASAALGYVVRRHGRPELAPPIRNFVGGMRN